MPPCSRLALALLALAGCGSAVRAGCDDACDRLFAPDGECVFLVAGMPQDDATEACHEACATAAGQDGTIEDFDPEADWETSGVRELASLNRAQLEAWTSCVDEKTCQEMDQGGFLFCGAAP